MSQQGAAPELPCLEPIEARILGALVEKQATTPEAYPLTDNALLLACNQKNNREPLTAFTVGELGHALRTMEARGWVRSVHGARAQRWEHRMAQAFSLTQRQQALLSVCLLRGPQTAQELATRSERLADFDGPDAVRDTLDRMIQRDPALLARLQRASGQREDRYMHLLAGPVDALIAAHEQAAAAHSHDNTDRGQPRSPGALEARVAALEAEVARLRALLEPDSSRDSTAD
ncbi:YceH family protein [soil metagenome]